MKMESIQVLRFIAAISIILYHSSLFGEHGYLGVDILFIISGYVIMKATELNKPYFLLRRFIRIVPLYWISTFLLFGILYVAPELSIMSEASLDNLVKSLLFIPIAIPGGYNVPLLGVGWTINYEIYFYILFSLCLIFSYKYREYLCIVLIGLLCILGYKAENTDIIKYIGNSVLMECAFGIFLYLIDKRKNIKANNSTCE